MGRVPKAGERREKVEVEEEEGEDGAESQSGVDGIANSQLGSRGLSCHAPPLPAIPSH